MLADARRPARRHRRLPGPAPTRARTAGGSRCTPSTCRPTATPPTCRSEWGAEAAARRGRRARRHGPRSAARSGWPTTWPRRSRRGSRPSSSREPIEDLRLDFEDGYGTAGDEAEDADAVAVAGRLADALAAGAAPAFVGLRFKCFEAPTRRRGLRTLDLFLSTLLERPGALPDGLVITFPKVSTVSQVEAMVAVCEAYEAAAGLPAGRLGFEIQVETPQLILGADGTAPVAAAIHAGAGRVTSLHYGTYDYSASLQVSRAEYQSMEHPVADYAKDVMQAAVGRHRRAPVRRLDQHPPGRRSDEQSRRAWRLHHRPGPARPGTGLSTRAGTCTPPSCRPASSPTSPSTARVSPAPPHRLRDVPGQGRRRRSWTSRPPPGRWPATSTAASSAARSTTPS